MGLNSNPDTWWTKEIPLCKQVEENTQQIHKHTHYIYHAHNTKFILTTHIYMLHTHHIPYTMYTTHILHTIHLHMHMHTH